MKSNITQLFSKFWLLVVLICMGASQPASARERAHTSSEVLQLNGFITISHVLAVNKWTSFRVDLTRIPVSGVDVTVTVVGAGYIKENSDDPAAKSIRLSVNPSAFFGPPLAYGFSLYVKSTSYKPLDVRLTTAFGRIGLQLDKEETIAYRVKYIYEKQQKCNRVPFSANRERYKLYLATEPIGDKAKIHVSTTLQRRAGSPKYLWGVASTSLSAGNDWLAKGPMPDSGEVDVSYASPSYTFSGIQYFAIGVDENKNGKFEINEAVRADLFEMVTLNNQDCSQSKINVGNLMAATYQTQPATSFLLELFLNQKVNTSRFPVVNGRGYRKGDISFSIDRVSADNGSLTHIAGAKFVGVNCEAVVAKYTFRASSSMCVKITENDYIQNILKGYIRDELHKIDPTGSLPIGTTKKFSVPLKITGSFPGGIEGIFTDLHNSIGGHTLKGNITVNTGKGASGRWILEYTFRGEIEDLYDFDYNAKWPAPEAAKVQIGWRGGKASRSSGKIYIAYYKLQSSGLLYFWPI